MCKEKIIKLLGLILTIDFIILAVTGIIKFPEFKRFFSFAYLLVGASTISLIHDYAGLTTAIIFFVLIALRRGWCSRLLRVFKKKEGAA